MRARRGERAAALALALVVGAAPALAGCGRQVDLEPSTPVGGPAAATVLVDRTVEMALAGTLATYAKDGKRGFLYGAGSPDDITSTVKNGQLIDMVVLPAGPALDRVENELLKPPTLFGTVGSTTYYLGAVTLKALPFDRWLPTPKGRAALRANGVR